MTTVGSLFSGVGGFDLGFARAGFDVRWQCEIDLQCQDVLRRNFPETEVVYTNVCTINRHMLEPVDVICGGFPCQDVSVAGRRAGLDGERSGLWHEYHRILNEMRPEWCVIENVPGLLSSCGCATCGAVRRLLRVHAYLRKKRGIHQPCALCRAGERMLASHRGRDFAVVLRGLVELGYGVAWRVHDAQYHGVPQRRRRVFIVGHLGDGRAAEVLFEPECVPGNPPPRRETGQSVAAGLTRGSGVGSNDPGRRREDDVNLVPSVTAKWAKGSGGPAGDEAQNLITAHQNTGHGWWNESDTAQTLQTPDGGGSLEANVVTVGTLDCRNDVFNDEISGTVQTKANGGQSLNFINPVVIQNGARPREYRDPESIREDAPMYTLDGRGEHAVAFAQNQRGELRTSAIAPQLTTGGGKPGEGYPAIAIGVDDHTGYTLRANASHSGDKGDGGVNTTLVAEVASPLVDSGARGWSSTVDSPNFIPTSPMAVRRLMPVECERLMGWPDDWTRYGASGKEMSDSTRYRMCGNGVVASVSEWIARRIAAAL